MHIDDTDDMAIFLIFLFGLVIGSFLNVLIDRIPRGENIVWVSSHCDFCHKTLRWFELIPVLSFLLLGGVCLRCRRRLSIQYPVVELTTGIGFVLVYRYVTSSPVFLLAALCIFSALLVIFVIDSKHQVIPDGALFIIFVAVLVLAIPLSPTRRVAHAVTGCAAGAFFWFLWLITRRRGLGFGDVKLAAILGALLGYPYAVIAFYAAFLTGAGMGVILIMTHRARMKSRIAFGPFLIIGTAIAGIWGGHILIWWRSLL